jgi:hypothetical protein
MKRWMDIGAQALCIAAALGGLAVVVWVLASGMPGRQGMDAMFLLVVGLTFAVFFGFIPARALLRRRAKSPVKGEAKAGAKAEVSGDRSANA